MPVTSPASSASLRASDPTLSRQHRLQRALKYSKGAGFPGTPWGEEGSDMLRLHLERSLASVRKVIREATSWESRERMRDGSRRWGWAGLREDLLESPHGRT